MEAVLWCIGAQAEGGGVFAGVVLCVVAFVQWHTILPLLASRHRRFVLLYSTVA
jgi:hypothetical protein